MRANDQGDLVVTKGDQYDVRARRARCATWASRWNWPGDYYEQGADEITFLNITGFRDFPLQDMPMLEVLEQTSKNVFVPLTIGGGIRDFTDRDGQSLFSALEVASHYFRSGADKVSIGSDAVLIVEEVLKTGRALGSSSIEQIARVYGNQAVVISIDPRRVYVDQPEAVPPQGDRDRDSPARTASATAGTSAPSRAAARVARSMPSPWPRSARQLGAGRDPAQLHRPRRHQLGL